MALESRNMSSESRDVGDLSIVTFLGVPLLCVSLDLGYENTYGGPKTLGRVRHRMKGIHSFRPFYRSSMLFSRNPLRPRIR